jgi:hypothetical protein
VVPLTLLDTIQSEINGAAITLTAPRHLRKPAWLSLAYADPGLLLAIDSNKLSLEDLLLMDALIKVKLVSP